MTLALAALVLVACTPELPVSKPEPPPLPEPRAYRTPDGRVFGSERERADYLRLRAFDRIEDDRQLQRLKRDGRSQSLSALDAPVLPEPGVARAEVELAAAQADLDAASRKFRDIETTLRRGGTPVGPPTDLARVRNAQERAEEDYRTASNDLLGAKARALLGAGAEGSGRRHRSEDILIARYADHRLPDEPRGTFLLRIRRAGQEAIEKGGTVGDWL